MKTLFSIAFSVLICFSLTAQTKEKKTDLTVKTYSITLTSKGGKSTGWQWKTDEISFKTGLLKSKMMSEHEKFNDAKCAIDEKSDASGKTMSFKAEGENESGSKINWKGKVTGDHIEGTVVWTNMQGKHSYSFTGIIK